MDKYSWSFDRDAEFWYASADSIEACIAEAKTENEDDSDTVYIGENTPFVPHVDVDLMLERIVEEAFEFVGEVSEDWRACDYKKREELDELSASTDQVVTDWMRKYGYYPVFYQVENIKPYPLANNPELIGGEDDG